MHKNSKYYLLAILLIPIISLVIRAKKGISTFVSIDSGIIEGIIDSTNEIKIFKGIPFAEPPVGDLRWKAPQPVKPWKGIRKCTTFGASPMQNNPTPFLCWSEEYLIPKKPISEDCLYLNVWTGAKLSKEKRPVLVYIYGGAFITGGSACPIYDGEAMAQKGIVFISFNYRLGKFGFMAHPELSEEAKIKSSGNYALLDMIAALRWVKMNISAFGGDSENVTIAGQSAGAVAINYLITSPLTKGLFHKVIAESGARFYSAQINENSFLLKNAEKEGINFAKSLNCNTVAEMRAESAEEILKATNGFSSPIIDGYVIIENAFNIYKKGKQYDVPILLGWNKDDLEGGPITKTEFKGNLQSRFGELSEEFLKEYPANTDEEAAQSLAYMIRDEYFGFEAYTWAKMQTETGKSNVFIYNFNRDLPGNSAGRDFGAFHSGEIPYAYNNLHILNRPWAETDHKIANMMSDYWVNFAKTGNPNGAGLSQWDAYDSVNEKVMVFDSVSESIPLPTKTKLLIWEKYYTSNN